MDKIIGVEVTRFGVNLRFDDGSNLKLRKKDVENFKLRQDVEIDKETLYQKICTFQFGDAFEQALSFLDRSARTESEIKKKLLLKGYLPEVNDSVCERLHEMRLLDDKYIAERIVSSMSASGKGKFAVKQKLMSRGISGQDIESALDEISDEQQAIGALEAAKKLERKYSTLERRLKRQKLSQALSRRGFSWDSIEFALSKLTDDYDE